MACILLRFQQGTGKGGTVNKFSPEKGAIGYILMWLLGIPIPILLAIFLLRGCD
jgi:hypothetical protein